MRSFRLALVGLTAAAVALLAVAAVLLATGPLGSIWLVYSYVWLAAAYTGAGLVAWWRRPVNRLGPLMVACGAAWWLGSLQNTGVAALIAVGTIAAVLPLSVVVHLIHASPSGRLRNRTTGVVVAAAYVIGVVLQVPLWAFTAQPPPYDVLMVADRPHLAEVGLYVQESAGVVLVVVTLVLLRSRLREYDALQRRVLAPLFGYGVVAVLSIPLGSDLLQPLIGRDPTVTLQLVTLTGLPLGLVVVMLRGGFGRTSELSALVSSVASSSGSHRELQEAVARTLGDPSARVLRSVPGGGFADVDGEPVVLPYDVPRATTPIETAGRTLGVLDYDAELTSDPTLPQAMARVAGIALDREQLAAEASANRVSLQEASARLLDESDRTRRRIASDLHDGLQASLVGLSVQAHLIAEDPSSSDTRELAARLAAEVDRAAVSLRALVEGVMPPHLLERGLGEALRELVVHLPVRVRLDLDRLTDGSSDRLPEPVESTAYFVVAEALTNVVKHAGVDRARVTLAVDGDLLTVVVADEGAGGAHETRDGVGLGSLRDRVRVLGGTFALHSDTSGTRLEVRLPCGS